MSPETSVEDEQRTMIRREGEWELWRERTMEASHTNMYTSLQTIRCRHCGRIIESGEAIEMGISWKKLNKSSKHAHCGGDA